MSPPPTPRFDPAALLRLAGDNVFARGEAYHREGQVEILSADPSRIVARVAGTEDYRTELRGRDADIGGECSCPAYEDRGFCKHMVASALAANAVGETAEEAAGPLDRIAEYLRGQNVEALVDMILGLAERDRALFDRLDLSATVAHGDDKALAARLRKAVDQATRTGGYVDYREAANWAAGVDAALDAIAELVAAGRGGMALQLVERALDRIERAIEAIDDSDGHCGGLLDRCGEIHLAAARLAPPDPIAFAAGLFARETSRDYDVFRGAAARYSDVLGEAGLREYRRLAAEAWETLPAVSGGAKDRDASAGDYHGLMVILDFFAEQEGDIDARIALRAKDLSSPWAYLQLAEFCLAQGRPDEALARAEEGVWLFEDDRHDERLVCFTAALLSTAKRQVEAESLLRRFFERAPSLELYARLRACGPIARDRAIAWLRARLDRDAPTRWYNPADFLVRVLTQEKAYSDAWAVVGKHGASLGMREALARASESAHPREAIEVYAERIGHLVDGGGHSAYAEAVDLIGRIGGLQSRAEQAAYVATLKARFGRKRNFIKMLG